MKLIQIAKYAVVWILICSVTSVLGQDEVIDSYLKKADQLGESYPDSLLYFSIKAQKLAKEVGNDRKFLEAKAQEWRYYHNSEDFEPVWKEQDSLLLVYSEHPDPRLKGLLIAESLVTDALYVQSNQTSTLVSSVESLSVEVERRFWTAKQGDIFEVDSFSTGRMYMAIGILKFHNEDFDSSLMYLQSGVELFEKLQNYRLASQASAMTVACGILMDDYEIADNYLPKAIDFAGRSGSIGAIINAQVMQATYHEYMTYDRAKAIEIRSRLDSIYTTVPSEAFDGDRAVNAHVLYRLERNEENYEEALRWDELLDSLNGARDAAEVRGKMLELNAKYDLATKEKELLGSELSRKRLQVTGLILGFGFILAALLLSISRMNKRRREEEYEKELNNVINRQERIAMNAMIDGQNNERERVGKELHDSLGSILATANMTLSAVKENGSNQNLDNLDKILVKAVYETRRLSKDLLNGVLTKFGLVVALEDLAESINHSGMIEVRFNVIGIEERFTAQQELNLYRIAQELITNAIKHANATSIVVNLMRREGMIHLIVKDNGKGNAEEAIKSADGVGWQSIRSRVALLKGSASLESAKNAGTKVTVVIPFKSENE